MFQFRQICKKIECLRVCKCLSVFHQFTMDDFSNRKFNNLATLGAWDIRYLYDTRRHMTRCCVLSNLGANDISKITIQDSSFS